MALLNLGNSNHLLRVEAYGLLAALASSFNLSVQLDLWEVEGGSTLNRSGSALLF